MALSTGNKATFTDINSVKTAIQNACSTTGASASWSSFPSGAGVKITAAAINQMNSNGYAAAQKWVYSSSGNTVNSNSACTSNRSHSSGTGGFGRAFRYSKCGGESQLWHIVGHNFQQQQEVK